MDERTVWAMVYAAAIQRYSERIVCVEVADTAVEDFREAFPPEGVSEPVVGTCYFCGCAAVGQMTRLDSGKLVHSSCWESRQQKPEKPVETCYICGNPVAGAVIINFDGPVHPDCYRNQQQKRGEP